MKKTTKKQKGDSPKERIKVAEGSRPLPEEDYAREGGEIFVGGFACAPPWVKDRRKTDPKEGRPAKK